MNLQAISDSLVDDLKCLRFTKPVTHVYNPLEYARRPHHQYLKKYGRGRREVILLGMNPGPWGMVQTGVPFGEVSMVRDWLGINAPVDKPLREHPKRRVTGFECTRSEVSGARLWGLAKAKWKTPEKFFSKFYIANYCPLAFLEETGRNFTPDKLPVKTRENLLAICDYALQNTVKYLKPRIVIGVGAFAESRAKEALKDMDVAIGRILHPSPASPAANKDWAGKATGQLKSYGIFIP